MPNFTPNQLQAINTDNNYVMVSASAGSGKTTVMVERIIDIIIKGKASIDQILAVTFTNLSAESMKEKLKTALTNAITQDNKERIKEQLSLLSTASIMTIDSFCVNLLRNYFYEVGLNPAFEIIESDEADRIKNETLSRLFEDKYESKAEEFLTLVKTYARRRKDERLKNNLLLIYEVLKSEENPDALIENTLNNYTEQGYAKVKTSLLKHYQKLCEELKSRLEKITEMFNGENSDYENNVKQTLSAVNNVLNSESLEQAVELSKFATFERTPTKRDSVYLETNAIYKDVKGKVKDLIGEILELYIEQDYNELNGERQLHEKFFNLYREFYDEFISQKRKQNVVDFDDMERLTLQLLSNDAIKREISSRFKYIFADECQDINGVQDKIISLLNRDNNLFMVGDLKQSIYGFRGCNSELFDKRFQLAEINHGAINLDTNFRSGDNVIKGINKIFSRTMQKDTCSIDYAKTPMIPSSLYPENNGEIIFDVYKQEKKENKEQKLAVYDVKDDLENLIKNENYNEGKVVADIIKQELNKDIYDAKLGRYRNVTLGDIAILSRTLSGEKYNSLINTLLSEGIEISTENKTPIVNYSEIQMLINLLKLIDRSNLDVPLVSTLKSPVGNFSDDELYEIRCKFVAEKSFCTCAERYSSEIDDEISKKLGEFYEYINRIRLLAEYENAGEILDRVIAEKGIDVNYLRSSQSEIKLKRIRRFVSIASGGTKKYSVREFLSKLDYIMKETTISESNSSDAVHIMTIHASKGLEFPIVISVQNEHSITGGQDKQKLIYADRDYGFAFKEYDTVKRIEKPNSLLRVLISKRIEEKTIREEMRIYYVALSRAMNRLHIVVEGGIEPSDKPFTFYGAKKYSSFLRDSDATVVIHEVGERLAVTEKSPRDILISESDKTLEKMIYDYLNFSYNYSEQLSQPIKRSVSNLNKTEDTPVFELSPIFSDTSAEMGTSYHKALELGNIFGEFEIEWDNLNKISTQTDGFLSMVDKDKLQKIFALPLFQEIKDYNLYKEQPFTANIPANLILQVNNSENVLVQGKLDLLAVKDSKAIIIDYKYSNKSLQDLTLTYKKQLQLYAFAVEKVLGLTTRAFLVNINRLEYAEINDLQLKNN